MTASDTARDRWDRQFRFAAILPDFQHHLDWLERTSATVRAGTVQTRLATGPDPRQWVEIVAPRDAGTTQATTLLPVFVHGGYWRALTAEGHRAVLPGLGGRHGAVGNVEYRLMPGARLADLVLDVSAGLRLLRQHTGRPLLVIGHSAGAHLALEALRRDPAAGTAAGAVALSGIYDLRPVRWSFVQDEIALTDEEVAAHSPLDAPPDVALLIACGEAETAEFQRQARALAAVTGAPVVHEPGAHHMAVLPALRDPASDLSQAIAAFADTLDPAPRKSERKQSP